MKKLLVVIAAVAFIWTFAAPASALDWNFYGSARMATFYVSDDLGDLRLITGEDDDVDTEWDLQSNSRFGATVKGENVRGRIEMGLTQDAMGTAGDAVRFRRVFGTWDFGAGTLKVGKDYTPVSQFISGQAFGTDLGLLGWGTFYGGRRGQIALQFGGFEIAAITVNESNIATAPAIGTTVIVGAPYTVPTPFALAPTVNDPDSLFPKIEASFGMSWDTFNFTLMGGFQYYEVEDVASAVSPVWSQSDVDVTSWVVGGMAGVNFGPLYIKGALSWSQNPGNAGWLGPTGFWDLDDNMDDTDFIQAALVAGFKVSDQLTFEIGGGWTDIDTDQKLMGVSVQDSNPWAVYGQAVIALAPGVWLLPEVGYFDNDDLVAFKNTRVDDAGSTFYIGGKWQIDF